MVSLRAATQTLLVTAIVVIMSVDYFFAAPAVKAVSDGLKMFSVPIIALTLIGSTLALYGQHARRVIRKQKEWIYDLVLIGCMTVAIITGFLYTPASDWIQNNVSQPLVIALWGFYCLFTASAAWRAFRVRSLEAGLLLVASVMTLLLNAPAAPAFWGSIPVAGNWVMNIPSMAATRGINIGVAIGTFAIAVKTMLGYEKTVSA